MMRPGEFFAEASLGSARYHCDAIATQSGTLLKVPVDALRLLLDTSQKRKLGITSGQ